MGREGWTRAGLVLVLLIGGLFLGQRLWSSQPSDGGPMDLMSFRQWWWERRGLDLAVQACLILTGALAIAALLPRPGETENGASPGGTPQDEMR